MRVIVVIFGLLAAWFSRHFQYEEIERCLECDVKNYPGHLCPPRSIGYCADCETWRMTANGRCPIDVRHSYVVATDDWFKSAKGRR